MFPTEPVYEDRADAGRRLADRLAHYAGRDVLVLALPRGGVPVAEVIADRLGAPLDVFVVRKIGSPGNPEYGLGAVAEGGIVLLDRPRVTELGLTPADLDGEIRRETQELERRVRRYRGDRPPPRAKGRTVILVDDGVATGGTARAAARALRVKEPKRLVLAVGVGSVDACEELSKEVDELVCPCIPYSFFAVGSWYRHFPQVDDSEVVRRLDRFRARVPEVKAGG